MKKEIIIPFNKPFLAGKETEYIREAVMSGKISGDGIFTRKCHDFFEKRYGFHKALLTTSCTDALEMAALLMDIKPGDEVIAPSYTFVSTVNAFVLRGAKIIFADSLPDHPNIDHENLRSLITPRTKAIVVVHYAGNACEMDSIMSLASQHGLFVVEDAAQAIDGYYKKRPLGSIGHLSTFSFHETKNIISGEGGMLVINEPGLVKRAEIIREKGTNRTSFFRGEVDKYGWVDIGSSFLPSEIIAAFLFAQLEHMDEIQVKRIENWNAYYGGLEKVAATGALQLPKVPEYSSNNAHMFYVVFNSLEDRSRVIERLRGNGILAVFHYLSLHKSAFYCDKHDGRELPYADRFTDTLLRLPLYYDLNIKQVGKICDLIGECF